MRFSVIIPLYNKVPYVAQALQSVADQTCQDYELIIVDDGSTDGSGCVAEETIANNQQLMATTTVIHQENSGVSTARNNGVAASHGNLICFLDADDWWEPTFLEEMSSLIDTYPDAGIYGTGYYIVKNHKKRVAPIGVTDEDFRCQTSDICHKPINTCNPSTHVAKPQGYINYCAVYARSLCMPLWTGAVCMTREVYDEFGGFRPHLKLGEDFDLWIKVALKYRVAFLDSPLSNYNQDVDVTYRGTHHLHDPKVHMLWNLDYLADVEKTNKDYKQLIDNLRTYGLLPYYLSNKYHSAAKGELDKVEWSKQSLRWKKLYNRPRWVLVIRQWILALGSKVKRILNS